MSRKKIRKEVKGMEKIILKIPYSWDDDRVKNTVAAYEAAGYVVLVIPVP